MCAERCRARKRTYRLPQLRGGGHHKTAAAQLVNHRYYHP